MNSVKKAASLISPDPLISTRRSSLPLASLDISVGDSSISEVVRKLKLSPCNQAYFENDEKVQVPKIVLERRRSSSKTLSDANLSFSNLSPFFQNGSRLNSFSPLENGQEFRRKSHCVNSEDEKESSLINVVRRASCGATFFCSSPDPRTKSPAWSKCLAEHCRNVSPSFQWNSKSPHSEEFQITKKKGLDESPSIRNQSCLHFPSLSPCFEDKPKLNNFPFAKSSEENSLQNFDYLNRAFHKDFGERNEKNVHLQERRASIQDSFSRSPRFPHGGVVWCPDSQLRRKSFEISPINVPECLDKSNFVNELEKGNTRLLTSSKRLDINTIIGKGGFGIVKVGFWKGEKVAVKIIKGRKAAASVKNEENSFKIGHHLNLVCTRAIVVPEDSLNARIESSSLREDKWKKQCTVPVENLQSIFGVYDEVINGNKTSEVYWSLIISELCTPTNLLSLINSTATISDIDKLRVLRQIASALNYMHQAGFVHLDVKPANCFLTPSGIVKLGDFGCTCKLNEVPTQPLGTVAYQAPEVLRGNAVTDRCDIYSFAVTGWQVLTLQTPFAGYHPHVIIYKVTRMNHRPTTGKLQPQTSIIESALFSVVKRCWLQLPYERPSAASVVRVLSALFLSYT